VSANFVNLNERGVLTQSGQNYDGTAQDSNAESRAFSSRMDASRTGLVGSAGNIFTAVADTHSGNLVRLAEQIAQQAVRAVQAERTVQTSDEEAHSAQSGTMQTVEGLTLGVSRPINAF
jgi:hypothetical protein